ncbi:ATPase family associated with various cellular activities (AAA) domain-containing protein [Hirsutella rhossiliensis]|uniref:Peroxisomal ATPase PEX1 n=1 Tax=Hirsutella rhossiliensis TaxID=111463 RepID=A0A9P8SG35_9HYPO|nr:ATPase family associated with various cellular activities (AAA) domain-containing protein [Hirsutella rhossiliensis]KAH0960724.1 ATPase family associated with various cellular activities (AAA) domain-containing protein [Hirsutella rhossiliensis]
MSRNLHFRTSLDRDVYQIIKSIEATHHGAEPFKQSVPAIYEAIKRSNSSLSRQKKRTLEDAIDRALQIRKQERQQDESGDSEAAIDEAEPPKVTENQFLLNRQLTKLWKMDQNSRASGEQPAAKKRRAQADGDDNDRSKAKTQQRSSRYIVEQPGQPEPFAGYRKVYLELLRYAWAFLRGSGLFSSKTKRLTQGILLSGPLGVGKKTLVRITAARIGVPIVSLARCFQDPERIEKSLSEAFDTAMSLAPSIIFIEQIDRSYNFANQMARIRNSVGQEGRVLVLATTSRAADVDPAILRFGLISESMQMRIPDCAARRDILRALTKNMALADEVDLDEIAKSTHGYVGSDLAEIAARSTSNLLMRMADAADPGHVMLSEHLDFGVHADFFTKSIPHFTPSLRQEGFTVIPSVTWDQVGALDKARKQLQTSIIGPIKNPELYQNFGVNRPAGVLLWGPPGCGKTLIAQAVANEAQASFILIDGPELLNKYVGESERAVRELFQRARSSTPCILFFDEIDSIVPPRNNSSTDSGARVVNALLAELDGVKDRTGIYVIGTTNRPEMIDEAMLRPGRLSVQLLVDLPTPSERVDILRAIYRTRHKNAPDETLERLAAVALDARCTNFSGADLSGLHTKAAEHALEEWVAAGGGGPQVIAEKDWEYALANTSASVKDIASYKLRAAEFV